MNQKLAPTFSAVGKPKHAAFVIDSIEAPHGTEMLAMILAGELVDLGWKVSIFTAEYTPATSAWTSFLQRHSIRVYRPPIRLLRRFWLPHRMVAARMWRQFAHASPTVIWSPANAILTCVALQAKPESSAPFFVHDPSEASPACPHYESLWFKVCNKVTALSVHGERQMHSAISYYGMTKPVEVIRPGTMLPANTSRLVLSEGRLKFGQFGRLATMKGSLFAVAALADCVARGGNAELHFHGDGQMKEATQELAASLGLHDRVFFHGSYLPHHLDAFVRNIDVTLMPSTYEGFGLVMLESLSRSRPVIATDVGSSSEILGDGSVGWVVPKANTTALADAMLACCNDTVTVLNKSRRAPQLWQSHFTPEKMTRRYLEFWDRHSSCNVNYGVDTGSPHSALCFPS